MAELPQQHHPLRQHSIPVLGLSFGFPTLAASGTHRIIFSSPSPVVSPVTAPGQTVDAPYTPLGAGH